MNDSNNNFALRKVNKTDLHLLFKWANDHEVRKWSFSKNAINIEDHSKWFEKKFKDPNVLLCIFENDHSPIGMIRLEKKDNNVFLNYLVSPQSRGKGQAGEMLKMAMNGVRSNWGNIKVSAHVIPENTASIKSLKKAGFTLEFSSLVKNIYVFHNDEKNGSS